MDFKERLQIELDELDAKYIKLNAFLGTDKCEELPEMDSDLLYLQADAMMHYISILQIRIKLLK